MLLLFLLALTPVQILAEESPWDSTIDYFKEHQLLPSRITIQTEIKDASGELLELSQLHTRLVRNGGGEILIEITDGLVDGRKIKADEMKTMAETLEEEELQSTLLLFSAMKKEFSWSVTDICSQGDGRADCSYSFSGRLDGRDVSGIIWLDKERHLPLSVSWWITDVPFSEENVKIRSLRQEDRFRINEDGIWCLGSSTTRISASYSFLTMKEEITVVTTEEYLGHIHRSNLPQNGDIAKF